MCSPNPSITLVHTTHILDVHWKIASPARRICCNTSMLQPVAPKDYGVKPTPKSKERHTYVVLDEPIRLWDAVR